jgi:hypothetical protein
MEELDHGPQPPASQMRMVQVAGPEVQFSVPGNDADVQE